MPQDVSVDTSMRKHNFLQNNLNSLRNDFDKLLDSFQGIWVHYNFIASLAAPSEVRVHTQTHTLKKKKKNTHTHATRDNC